MLYIQIVCLYCGGVFDFILIVLCLYCGRNFIVGCGISHLRGRLRWSELADEIEFFILQWAAAAKNSAIYIASHGQHVAHNLPDFDGKCAGMGMASCHITVMSPSNTVGHIASYAVPNAAMRAAVAQSPVNMP